MTTRAPTVLLTGASTGLGLAIARLLIADRGMRVVLTARTSSMPRFEEQGIVESDRVRLRPLDVTNGAERAAVVREMERDWGGVDALINNAGTSYRAVLEHVKEHEVLDQLAVNFLGPMELIRLVLPGMRTRRQGRILNISSVGGMMAMPTMALYSASKFALEGATEALWYEVRPWGIHVSLVEPGFINSSSFEKVHYTQLSSDSWISALSPYHAHYHFMEGFIAKVMRRVPSTPERVARTVMRTLRARRPNLRVPATLDAHIFSLLRRLLPRRLYHYALYLSLPGIRQWGVPLLLPRDRRDVIESEPPD